MSLVKNIDIRRWSFDYIYVFVMVVYMAQMTSDTGRMVGGISGNPIPFLIPIVLTVMVVWKHKITFRHEKFFNFLCLVGVWSVIIIIKYGLYNSTSELSYFFFLFYSFIVGYVHVKVYREKLFYLYEDIIVLLAKISIVLWCFSVFLSPVASAFFHLFASTGFGRNFIYLFNWMDPALGQYYSGIMRNAGCSWEPGRFSIMLCLGILINFSINGVRFKKNTNLLALLLALVTTQSTTGFSIFFIMLILFTVRKFSFKNLLFCCLCLIQSAIMLLQLDFMGDKISNQLNVSENVNEIIEMHNSMYSNRMTLEDGQEKGWIHAIDRFPSMYFEYQNVINTPILGYGLNYEHSYLYTKVSEFIYLCGGFMQILGRFGIFLGLYLFFILYRSSVLIANLFPQGRPMAFFMVLILSSFSYPILGVPIYTAIWLYSKCVVKSVN